MATKNVTKVICQNCGAEVIIHEHGGTVVTGAVIGKDSGLGTVILPTVNNSEKGNVPNIQDVIEQLRNTDPRSQEFATLLHTIAESIEDSGYIEVKGIVRRWLPAQCLEMVYSHNGFHQALMWKGYDYGWDVLINELRKQVALTDDNDTIGFADRNRWYNRETALCMASHFIDTLQKHIEKLPTRRHKKRPYVKLACAWLNKGKGVHTNEFKKLTTPLHDAFVQIHKAKTAKRLLEAVIAFNRVRKQIRFRPRLSNAFINAYKAAGAYYTMKDLILFENCRMKVDNDGGTENHENYFRPKKRAFIEKEMSLAKLEEVAKKVVDGSVNEYGYTMLGLLKDFLDYNAFNFDMVRQNWREQSEARRAARAANKKNRRTRK